MKLNQIAINRKDLTGKVYKNLMVLAFSHIHTAPSGSMYIKWLMKCGCGKEFIRSGKGFGKGNGACAECSHKLGCVKREKDPYLTIIKTIFTDYKLGAKRRKLSFSLSLQEFIAFIKQECYYCGDLATNKWKHRVRGHILIYNGIDRINNSKGYVANNCVSCCKICNIMKMTLGQEEFYAHIEKIYNKRIK